MIFAIFVSSVELTGLSLLRASAKSVRESTEAPAFPYLFPLNISTSSSVEGGESSWISSKPLSSPGDGAIGYWWQKGEKLKVKKGSESMGYASKMLNSTFPPFLLFRAPSFPKQGKAEMGQDMESYSFVREWWYTLAEWIATPESLCLFTESFTWRWN